MSTKFMKFSSLAALALSVSLLTACGSESKEPTGFAPKTTQSAQPSSTSTKDSASKQAATPASSSSSNSKSSSASITTSQKPSSSPVASSTPVASSQTGTSSAIAADSTEKTPSTQTTSAENNQATQTAQTTASNEQYDGTPVSPGVTAGSWTFVTINADGRGELGGSPIDIATNEAGESGVRYLSFYWKSGHGGYIHYYPAGVKIPFNNFEDPTDSSKDRLIHGNGAYLPLQKDDIENFLKESLSYRN